MRASSEGSPGKFREVGMRYMLGKRRVGERVGYTCARLHKPP